MEYQIISFNRETGSIEVLYRKNDKVLGIWNIDIPIENGNYISGAKLETRILAQYPSWVLERADQIAAGIANEAEIAALVVPLNS
jgi:hypothetical protein